MFDQILDANINRVCEGLRVIEEYVRFVVSHETLTQRLSGLRKQIHKQFPQESKYLHSRSVSSDVRAKERPQQRSGIYEVLVANFKRVQEALRVLEEYAASNVCNALRYDVYELEREILLLAAKPVLRPGVYAISHDVTVLKKAIDDGAALVQLRDKEASKEHIYNKSREIAAYAKLKSTFFIVNDYLDIALLVDAEGLHTGQDDISPSEQRRLLGEHKLIGRTTHSLEQGLAAESQGVDYVSVGPIWDTPSKPNRPGIGLSYLESAQQSLTIPYVAIGGVDDTRVEEIMRFSPPMIGIIRAHDYVAEWTERFFS